MRQANAVTARPTSEQPADRARSSAQSFHQQARHFTDTADQAAARTATLSESLKQRSEELDSISQTAAARTQDSADLIQVRAAQLDQVSEQTVVRSEQAARTIEERTNELASTSERSTSVVRVATELMQAIINLLALPVWGRYGDRVGHRRALVVCAIGSVLALGVQAAASIYMALLLGRMFMGVAMAGTGPLAFGLAAAEVAAERRGGAFGVVFSARTLAVAVGGMAGGALSAVIGVRGLMVLSMLMLLASVVAFRRQAASRGSPEI